VERHVVAIAGAVGAGKSTLARGLARNLGDASLIYFDHYEQATNEPIEKIRQWMLKGAGLDEWQIPQLSDHLAALKNGESVIDPMTKIEIPAQKYVVFETQFGRTHQSTGRHIDFLIWIDTPLDLALARKIRQFSEPLQRTGADSHKFAVWLHAYLENYLTVVGELLRIQRETVGGGADVTVDGTQSPASIAQELAQTIKCRFN
jgi:uridine kinase